MEYFLDQVASNLIENQSENFENLIVVLPSQRAGLFLKNKLTTALRDRVTILPEVISIETFINDLSGLENCDNETLLLLFYEAYSQVNPEKEKKDFESFLSWGQTLLQDFNEIDRYLIDHEQFFNYLYFVKDQRHWFLQENKTGLIENYIQFWERLFHYYKAFTKLLLQNKKGYQGLQYRKASEKVVSLTETTKSKFLFVGFNALNEAEQHIFRTLEAGGKANFVWDADAYFVKDKTHDASYFLKKHMQTWKNPALLEKSLHYSFEKTKEIIISGVPKNIGQVKYVGQLLAKLTQEEITKTAVVLADETLLLPLLNSLPGNVKNVNITMGLPLSQVPLTSFVNHFFELKQSLKDEGFYFKNVILLFQHTSLKVLLGVEKCKQIIKHITYNNYVYVTVIMLKTFVNESEKTLIEQLFNPWEDNSKTLLELETILIQLRSNYESKQNIVEEYYCEKLLEITQHVKELVSSYSYANTLKVIIHFFNLKLNSETIDFRGEPFEGLQIMGVLESRCLDFETLIITSINEGTLPSGQKGNSFIPYDLKIESKLPTFKEKDAIYAYHFYRLLQRCKKAYLTYNTQVDELNSGEKSRFIQQLELEPHPNHNTISQIVSASTFNSFTPILEIKKDKTVLDKIAVLAQNGFSPSALGTYLRDPLAYYERYILGVDQSKKIEEEIAANTLGTIIHEVLCNLYTPLEGKIVKEQDIKTMLSNLEDEVIKEFKKNYSAIQVTHGINFLSFEAAKQFLKKFLQTELALLEAGNELVIVSIEKKYKTKVEVPTVNFPVYIKGTVDRVDRFNGTLRIIDYKTGYVDPTKLKIKNWELLRNDDAYSKALQILIYAYIYYIENRLTENVLAGIIAFKKLNQGFLPFGQTEGRKLNSEINTEVFNSFLTQLEGLIQEICNINEPFVSNEHKNT